MSWWHQQPVLAYDVESTGTNPHEDRILQAALVEVPVGARPRGHTWLLNPGIEIPQESIDVHGLTNDHIAEHGTDPHDAILDIVGRLALALGRGIPVVAMNAAFDLTFIEAETRRHDIPTLTERLTNGIRPIIDPGVLDKHGHPYRKVNGGCKDGCGAEDKKLVGLCLHYKVAHTGAHDAQADALAAARLWPRILDAYPDKFRGIGLAGLHQGQVKWRWEQQASLRAYFDRNGTEHDGCQGDWPVLRAPQEVTR